MLLLSRGKLVLSFLGVTIVGNLVSIESKWPSFGTIVYKFLGELGF